MKPYGRLPRQLRPLLPSLVDTLRTAGVRRSPYSLIGEWLGVSPSRVQQVVLTERRRLEMEARIAVTEAGNQEGPVGG